jgi:hypothetical protein
MLLTIVESTNGDWIGVYKGGKLVFEDHMIEPQRLLKLAGVSFEYTRMEVPQGGYLPKTLGGVTGGKT